MNRDRRDASSLSRSPLKVTRKYILLGCVSRRKEEVVPFCDNDNDDNIKENEVSALVDRAAADIRYLRSRHLASNNERRLEVA